MLKAILKRMLKIFGLDLKKTVQVLSKWSLKLALSENNYGGLVERLREIEPDISKQYSHQREFNDYWELKLRVQHAFQCSLMLKVLENIDPGTLTVVDVGDSAGTHMSYLKELAKERFDIQTISVNLDPIAIEKIRAKGQRAILCRAEELDLGDEKIDLFTSFQMVEHLHNPSLFLRHLAKKSGCDRLVVTVPYMKRSRIIEPYFIWDKSQEPRFAEEEHIFELNPQDWALLMLHSGWKVVHNQIYYQYPRRRPFISQLLSFFWKETDFEGFWGAILERDTIFSDSYQDWEN